MFSLLFTKTSKGAISLICLALLFCAAQVAHAQNLSIPEQWNKQNCRLSPATQIYSVIVEEIANRLQVHPNSVTLERLAWTDQRQLSMGWEACWGTFYSPRGTQLCSIAFDQSKAIFRAGCNGLGPNICAGSCDQIKRLGLEK